MTAAWRLERWCGTPTERTLFVWTGIESTRGSTDIAISSYRPVAAHARSAEPHAL
jgi:hypothetical protein